MSGGNTIAYQFLVQNQQQVLSAFASINNALQTQATAIHQIQNQNKKHLGDQQTSWRRITSQIGSAGVGLIGYGSVAAGVLTTIRLMASEWNKVIEAQKKSQELRSKNAIPFQEMNLMAVLDRPGVAGGISTPEQLNQFLRGQGEKNFLTMEQQNRVAAGILSSKNKRSVREGFAAQDIAGTILPGNEEGQLTLATSMMDLSRSTGEQDLAKVTAFMLQGLAQSRVANTVKFAENLTGPMLAGTATGDTPEETMERIAQVQVGASDESGELSATLFSRMAEEMTKFVPERTMKGTAGKRHRFTAADIKKINETKEKGLNDFLELTAIDERLADAFKAQGGSFGKGKVGAVARAIIDGKPIRFEDGSGFDPQASLGTIRQGIGAVGNQESLAILAQKQQNVLNDPSNKSLKSDQIDVIGDERAALDARTDAAIRENAAREVFFNFLEKHNEAFSFDPISDAISRSGFNADVRTLGRDPFSDARSRIRASVSAESADEATKESALRKLDEKEAIFGTDGGDRPARGKNAVANDRGIRRAD